MPYELNEIKLIRKKLSISQIELANHSGVSQSLIAKVESGRLDPSYSNAQKIFKALSTLSNQKSLKASDVMNSNLISVRPNDNIHEAVRKMKKHQISQMPVIQDNKSVGLVSEASILEAFTNDKAEKVEDVMIDAPPVVSMETPISVLSNLLKFYPLVLVSEKGKLNGVITRADIITKL